MIRAAPLRRYSERTITDADKLVAELARIRAEGVGIDNEEFAAGMVAVAVPVFDRNQRAFAALAVHAPVVRLSLKAARRHLPALRKAAAALSDLLCASRRHGKKKGAPCGAPDDLHRLQVWSACDAHAAAEALAPVGTEAMVLRICEAIW